MPEDDATRLHFLAKLVRRMPVPQHLPKLSYKRFAAHAPIVTHLQPLLATQSRIQDRSPSSPKTDVRGFGSLQGNKGGDVSVLLDLLRPFEIVKPH